MMDIWLEGCRKRIDERLRKDYLVVVRVGVFKRMLKRSFKRKSEGLNYGLEVVKRVKRVKTFTPDPSHLTPNPSPKGRGEVIEEEGEG